MSTPPGRGRRRSRLTPPTTRPRSMPPWRSSPGASCRLLETLAGAIADAPARGRACRGGDGGGAQAAPAGHPRDRPRPVCASTVAALRPATSRGESRLAGAAPSSASGRTSVTGRAHLGRPWRGYPTWWRCRRCTRPSPSGGRPGQDRYLNVVVELDTELGPRDLLAVAGRLEPDAGRRRDVRRGPRTSRRGRAARG